MVSADELRQQQKDIWAGAAGGWERQDAWFDRQTRDLTAWFGDAIGAVPGCRVLDLACGGGQPALTIATRIRPGGTVVATDLSPQMLAVTARKAVAAGLDNVEPREMGAEHLEFPDASFDAVTCRFGLMLFPDPARAVAEIHRVLRPGGRFAAAVWDEPARNPYFTTSVRTVAGFITTPPPDPTLPGVFRLAAPGLFEETLRAGGFTDVTVESRPMTMEFASFDEYWTVQADLSGPVRTARATMAADDLARLEAALREAVAPHQTADGVIRLVATPLTATGAR